MTPTKTDGLREAVLNAMGWRAVDPPAEAWSDPSIRPSPKTWWISCEDSQMPPLTLDLCHEAEKTLNKEEMAHYITILQGGEPRKYLCQSVVCATAEQRAIAFCKVKGITL